MYKNKFNQNQYKNKFNQNHVVTEEKYTERRETHIIGSPALGHRLISSAGERNHLHKWWSQVCLGMLALGGAALAAREAPFKQAHRGLYPRIVLAKNKVLSKREKKRKTNSGGKRKTKNGKKEKTKLRCSLTCYRKNEHWAEWKARCNRGAFDLNTQKFRYTTEEEKSNKKKEKLRCKSLRRQTLRARADVAHGPSWWLWAEKSERQQHSAALAKLASHVAAMQGLFQELSTRRKLLTTSEHSLNPKWVGRRPILFRGTNIWKKTQVFPKNLNNSGTNGKWCWESRKTKNQKSGVSYKQIKKGVSKEKDSLTKKRKTGRCKQRKKDKKKEKLRSLRGESWSCSSSCQWISRRSRHTKQSLTS